MRIAKQDRSVFETRHRRRDGSVFDVEITAQPLELDGQPVLFNSARDIAERRQAEQLFRAAAEANLDGLLLLKSGRGPDGTIADFEITEINTAAERILGLTRGQVIGQKLCVLLPMYRTLGFFDKFVAVATTGTPLEEEFLVDTPQIKATWLRQQVVRVGDGVAVTSRDISAWKAAGAQLRENENRLRLAMEVAHMQAWSMDVGSGEYSFSGDGGSIFGLPPEAAPRTPGAWLGRVHPADRDAVARLMGENRENSAPSNVEYRMAWPDGSIHWVESRSDAICDAAGKPVRRLGVLLDITERHQHDLAIQKANRALRTLSAANEALVRATSEDELLQTITRIVVEQGSYRLVAVGYAADDPEMSITPMAWSLAEDRPTSEWRLTWPDTKSGQTPIARAIRSGTMQVCQDIASDPGFGRWKEFALAHGCTSNLVLPLSDGVRTFGGLSIYSSETGTFGDEEIRLLTELANDLAYGIVTLRTRAERDRIAFEHAHYAEILQKSLEQSIQVIADTVEARDPYTAGHQRHVDGPAVAIARELGPPEDIVHGIHLAAVIHDLGKIRVPAELLSKPGKLSDIEFMLIKMHPQAGYDILKDVDFPWPIAKIILQHHERLDGSGYPQGLKNGQILLEARIMAVADVVEAMCSHRPYRAGLGIDTALAEVERGRGTAYDPNVADACLRLFREKGYQLPA